MNSSVSVIVPAYNEESRILPTLERLSAYLKESFSEFEIIVVDDGSADKTAALTRELGQRLGNIRLISYSSNMGKGYAVKTGVASSKSKLVVTCDADMSTPIEELEKLLPCLNNSHAIAVGSRALQESDIVIRQPWYRERMGRTFNLFVRTLVMGGIRDTQCGFKLFRGDVARELFARSLINGFSFDVEILFLAGKAGYAIKEVPVRWFNSLESRVMLLTDPARMFLDLLHIRFNWLAGRYHG